MYRSAAKRLFLATRSIHNSNARLRSPAPQIFMSSSRFSTAESPPFSDPRSYEHPSAESPKVSDSNSSSSSSTSSSSTESASSTAGDDRRHKSSGPRAKYQDEQARVLHASLPHVIKLGWTEAALIAGAREVGLSPSIIGSLPRKEAALVESRPWLLHQLHRNEPTNIGSAGTEASGSDSLLR